MRGARVRLVGACLSVLVASGGARAGDRDTHLTATHYLALQAGFTPAQAELIARADWSMHLNLSTAALPFVHLGRPNDNWSDTNRATARQYSARGRTYHALGASPESIRTHVETLRDAVPPARAMALTRGPIR